MADIGMRPTDLFIKIEEKKVTIEEKKFAQKRMALELLRTKQRIHDYQISIDEIDRQISEIDMRDLEGLQAAYKAAQAAESEVK